MTDEEILAIAEATGLKLITLGLDKQKSEFFILAFAKLVAAKERESNIKIIKETPFSNWFQADVIEAIRARGEQA